MPVPLAVFTRDEHEALHEALSARPADQHWRVLVEGMLPIAPLQSLDPIVFSGCACCTGQIALKVLLQRLLRTRRLDRIVLLLSSSEHLTQALDVLRDPQYVKWLTVDRTPNTFSGQVDLNEK
ncbi:MAG TPA: hypothetical protein VFS42_07905 [Burkholderiaceae bacterium]|nr:hypothetical protein [Burkholderiaceae bacterium]